MAKKKKKTSKKKKGASKIVFDIDKQLRRAVRNHQSGQLTKAESIYRKILARDPEHPAALHFCGLIAHQQGDNEQAADLIRQAIENEPDNATYHNNLGLALEDRGELDEALSAYNKALDLDDSCYEAHTNIGNILMAQGNLEDAISHHQHALKINPSYTEALLNLVDTAKAGNTDPKELFDLAETLIQTNLPKDDLVRVCFALGKLCDALGMFGKGFEFFRRANTLKRTNISFNGNSHETFITQTIDVFTKEFMGNRQSWGYKSPLPVFILGMPRSGTTLVEQIIASHPVVFGGGELQFFVQAQDKLPAVFELPEKYPECVHLLNTDMARQVGKLYLKQVKNLKGVSHQHTRITDKNPFNFLYLGLISLLFSNAAVIHCTRHPLDVCLSNYFHLYTQGNHFAYDLQELGNYYLQYHRIMKHWRSVLPINVLEVSYEDLIDSQESMTRKLIAHCGLDWDPVCLGFHADNRPVFTASNWQVRQPIYQSYLHRWQNYDPYIEPLKTILADII